MSQITNKKFISLSNILQQPNSSNEKLKKKIESRAIKAELRLNQIKSDLLTVKELFKELQLECDEKIVKLDENERRQIVQKSTIKSINYISIDTVVLKVKRKTRIKRKYKKGFLSIDKNKRFFDFKLKKKLKKLAIGVNCVLNHGFINKMKNCDHQKIINVSKIQLRDGLHDYNISPENTKVCFILSFEVNRGYYN